MVYSIFSPYYGVFLGHLLHTGLFIHGEWHVQAPKILVCHLICFFGLIVTIPTAWQFIAGYLLGLLSSILIYRIFCHRLHAFPGPKLAKASKLWHLWQSRSSRNHFFMEKLQKEYGDFVRTGPGEITVFHPDVFMAIDGPRSKCYKGEWYDLLHPNDSLVNIRWKEIHRPRRRIWMQGFSSKALADGKYQAVALIDQLDRCIQDDMAVGRSSDISELIYWLSFDRMAQFVLGRSFNALSDLEGRFMVETLQKALSILGPLSPTPWLVQIILHLFPRVGILRDWFATTGTTARELRKTEVPVEMSQATALGSYLVKAVHDDPTQDKWLPGDSLLAFVAGSDPTAGIIQGLLFELARNPHQAEILYQELQKEKQASPDSNKRDYVPRCKHLEAAIFESMRLYPSLPSGGHRKTPPTEGITVAGVYIPADTTIVAPRYAISRREDSYVKPNEFIPERWTTRPEMVLNRNGFVPFGTASRSCLGRGLAMNDMMMISAHVIQNYRMRFPPSENGDSVLENWKDQFTSCLGRFQLRFERRTDRTDTA
ncbi:hypothetical protein N7507_006664, partial [Penicillium longicatenatum]